MVTVRFFGLARDAFGQREIIVRASTVGEILGAAAETADAKRLLRGALIFVNGSPVTGSRRFRRRLRDGDELAVLTPAGGG